MDVPSCISIGVFLFPHWSDAARLRSKRRDTSVRWPIRRARLQCVAPKPLQGANLQRGYFLIL